MIDVTDAPEKIEWKNYAVHFKKIFPSWMHRTNERPRATCGERAANYYATNLHQVTCGRCLRACGWMFENKRGVKT